MKGAAQNKYTAYANEYKYHGQNALIITKPKDGTPKNGTLNIFFKTITKSITKTNE